MTRIAKLYQQLLSGRRLSFAEFQRLLDAFGFRLDRVRGSHHTYHHAASGERLIIQPLGKEAKHYQVKQFLDKVELHRLELNDGP